MLIELIVGVLALLIIEICLYNEKFLAAIMPLAAFIAFINFMNFNIWQFLLLNANMFVIGIITYLIVGVGIALIRWKGYVAHHYKILFMFEKSYQDYANPP